MKTKNDKNPSSIFCANCGDELPNYTESIKRSYCYKKECCVARKANNKRKKSK